MKEWTQICLELTRFRIALLATSSTAIGFILKKQQLSTEIVCLLLGVFFLASGSSALNQYQERLTDRWMKRTKGRPLPSQRLEPRAALMIALLLLFLGTFTLLHGSNGAVLLLGILTVLWYNGLYTFLKRKTAFAAIPGALIGAIPPVLGWIHAGGNPFDHGILALASFFFVWQIPHFWLLLLRFGKDYEEAGLPSLTRIFTVAQLRRITFTWVFATAVICVMIPLFGLVTFYGTQLGLMMAGFWLVWKAFKYLGNQSEFSSRFTFHSTNIYILLVMLLLTLDHLL